MQDPIGLCNIRPDLQNSVGSRPNPTGSAKSFKMEGVDYIGIAIVHDGSLVRMKNGTYFYTNYKTKVTCVRYWCSKSELEDEVYKCLEVNRNAYNMKMKFLYGRASQPVEPIEIRRENDVRTFMSEVRHAPVRPLLYVELIPISPQLSNDEPENIAYTSRQRFKSGGNQESYASPSKPPTTDFYDIEVPESEMHFNVNEALILEATNL
ncbi:hypothetical protein FNV43_RR10265 [Rhamnella rubrinervis]|uniref:Uncharacterized protein n=1 Tax=Rhamnella rubrinervis TaxID=2594499 RepID=A0A8K0HBG9_9ROSA|nr:hypothetical protein FNV43_RR10265 [Rhamnella rubrinervis]